MHVGLITLSISMESEVVAFYDRVIDILFALIENSYIVYNVVAFTGLERSEMMLM